ncbi:MAG: hypothetical protein JWM80_4326 [Cyanobacteria bacterium RYN_339]|nr:hypothetical protein [Cyanobacteria bacterium RYN_339]
MTAYLLAPLLAAALVGTPQEPSPALAAGLAVAPGLAIYAATALTHAELANVAIPALIGAGHLYAGDPWRGLAASAGGYGALGVGAACGLAVGLAFPGGNAELLGKVLNGGFYGFVLYDGLAAVDAYMTTERLNAARVPIH